MTLARVASIPLTRGTFVALILLIAPAAQAQGPGRGMFNPDEMFDRVDKNGDGVLTGDEIRDSGRMSRMFEGMGIDGSQPVSRQQFAQQMAQGMERFRERMRSGGGGFGGPPMGGPVGPPGGGDERRDRRDRDRDRESPPATVNVTPTGPVPGPYVPPPATTASAPGAPTAPATPGKSTLTPKVRVTLALPDSYRNQDQNQDGQIGLYEWNRRDWTTFQRLDRDRDGFLTPKELVVGSGGSPSSSAVATTAPVVSGTAPTSVNSTPGAPPAVTMANSPPAPVASAATPSVDGGSARANTAFDALDVNKDGSISPDEWGRSRTMRPRFEAAGIDLTKPTPKATFVGQFERVMGAK